MTQETITSSSTGAGWLADVGVKGSVPGDPRTSGQGQPDGLGALHCTGGHGRMAGCGKDRGLSLDGYVLKRAPEKSRQLSRQLESVIWSSEGTLNFNI